jgi:type I restriction enzyme S subunit
LLSYLKNWIIGTYTQGGQPNLSSEIIKSISVAIPPTLAEQEAIAEALSDADALIEAIEQLIAKKRQIKQGAMSELLMGKRRLAGFDGKWEVKRLGEVLTLRYGKGQKDIIVNGGKFPIIATSGEVGRTNQYLYDKPSVIIGRKGTIDKPQYIDVPFWTIDTAYYSEISKQGNPKFLFYLLTTFDWYSYNEASGVPSLNAKTVENIEISLPALPEQTAIAEILSDMDAEISALEEKLSKARQVKAGMMSVLLTGKIRLV